MKKPNIIALPTSQMMAFCDLTGIPRDKQESMESMVVALDGVDFSKLKKGVTHHFDPDDMGAEIVAKRKAKLGRV